MLPVQLCSLLKSRVESPDFLEKRESAQVVPQNTPDGIACFMAAYLLSLKHTKDLTPNQLQDEEGSTWDMINEKDVWESGYMNSEEEDYVLVRQEDIVDGIACFMAAYLLSLKQTKDLTPNQLQDALSKTFSLKKKKGKLRKAWDGSKVIYNVASWGATAIGIYQNPALLRAASAAFWTSCNVISKLF
ncbi:RING finger protein 214 [Heracleum sosnowskyi]|uniref:RING finger protein 214 n=1 Tax=Heracleum sosnowskyi TaxID=360622 RepID=A0AAD8J2T1_9APIA|nr:RING finger protein 214 [Heracleum sosnowskyi]